MKALLLLISILSLTAFAEEGKIDLEQVCTTGSREKLKLSEFATMKLKVGEKEIVVIDKGFCAAFMASKFEGELNENYEALKRNRELELKRAMLDPNYVFSPSSFPMQSSTQSSTDSGNTPVNAAGDKADKWKVRFYMSHSFTTYFSSDIKFRSTRYNVDVKDYEWVERSSREFFLPSKWQEEGNNPFQWIDEPSNTFVISIEKNGHEFFLSAFHPKFLHNNDQVKYMKGVIDGTPVDGWQNVNRPFDGYNQQAGEMELVRNENTHLQMTFEIGYGYRFKILDTKIGNITWVPSVAVGVMYGGNYTVVVKEGEWWEFDDYKDKKGIQGIGGSITNRIEFNTKNDIFGIFYEHKIAGYMQKHGFMDGTQRYNIGFMGNSVGLKFKLYDPNNWKNGKRIKHKKKK